MQRFYIILLLAAIAISIMAIITVKENKNRNEASTNIPTTLEAANQLSFLSRNR